MSCSLKELLALAEREMKSANIVDYCPNGLQVEGGSELHKIVGGVTASQALIDAAIEKGADLLLVHHGFFWKGEQAEIIGIKRNRLKSLLCHDISLLAYHLPLDIHPVFGNNVGLGRALGLQFESMADADSALPLVSIGSLKNSSSQEEFADFIEQRLGRKPLHITSGSKKISRVAWCTGAAQSYIAAAAAAGADAYISGEISESTVHIARERGIDYFAAGHHATEKFGVQAFGQYLAEQMNINFEFIDIPNPA